MKPLTRADRDFAKDQLLAELNGLADKEVTCGLTGPEHFRMGAILVATYGDAGTEPLLTEAQAHFAAAQVALAVTQPGQLPAGHPERERWEAAVTPARPQTSGQPVSAASGGLVSRSPEVDLPADASADAAMSCMPDRPASTDPAGAAGGPDIPPEIAAHVLHTFGATGGSRPDGFTQALIVAIVRASMADLARLKAAYPAHAAAVSMAASAGGVARLQQIVMRAAR